VTTCAGALNSETSASPKMDNAIFI
jgi:hypothetical protein